MRAGKIDSSAQIGANAVIGCDVEVGANTLIAAGAVIGDGCKIGDNSIIYANVTVYNDVTIGHHVILHSGCVIGADGFGFAKNDDNSWFKIPQIGAVDIHDHVEIGANTSIDRGAINNTVIKSGVKIDNQVQIGHNVIVGENTIIAGCAGIAGSVTIGKNCMLGGACVVNGHTNLCDFTMLAGFSGILNDIEKPGVYASALVARPHREWLKVVSTLNELPEISRKLKELEKLSNV